MSTDFRALCEELTTTLEYTWDGRRPKVIQELIERARAALAQPEPVAPTDDDVTELFYRHMGEGSQVGFENAIAEALARWGTPAIQPVPVGVTDEALANFSGWFCRNYPGPDTIIHKPEWHAPKVFRAAAYAITRWGTPAIQPVPVSKRLPDPEECDAEGWCWWWHPGHKEDDFIFPDGWILLNPKWASSSRGSDDSLIYTHWLPANVLPTFEALPND